MERDADERSDDVAPADRFESGAMTMIGLDDPSRPAHLARVRDQVTRGRYHPPADAVAERLLAFFGAPLPR